MGLDYYLYRHIRVDKGTPFYIGVGTKPKKYNTYTEEYRRAFKKCDKGLHWKRIVNKHGYEVEIMLESDNYRYIKEKEIEFIGLYGRLQVSKNGLLINRTDGGDGTTGRNYKPTEETRKKMSTARKGKKISQEHLKKLNEGRRTQPTSEESRKRYSQAKLGVRQTESHRIKNSLAKRGANHPNAKKIRHFATGLEFGTIKEAAKHFNLHYVTLTKYLNKTIIPKTYAAHTEFQFV